VVSHNQITELYNYRSCIWSQELGSRLLRGASMKREAGTSLIETVAALALLGIISAVFLVALAASSSSRALADEHASARILAESQMEYVRQLDYATSYEASTTISAKYPHYTTEIDVDTLRNGHIQKITITIRHRSEGMTVLESYKVRRYDDFS